jgi:hypothetical protein
MNGSAAANRVPNIPEVLPYQTFIAQGQANPKTTLHQLRAHD